MVCAEGYAQSFSGCTECSDTEQIVIAVCLVIFVIIVIAVIVMKQIQKASLLSSYIGAKTKILVSFIQTVNQITHVYSIPFPAVFLEMAAWFNLFNLDFMQFAKLDCFAAYGFYEQLYVTTVVPFIVLFTLAVCNFWFHKKGDDSKARACSKYGLITSFLVFPGVSTTIFKTFPCFNFDDGQQLLKADLRVHCDDPGRRDIVVYAAIVICIFPVGIPLYYLFRLWKGKTDIHSRQTEEQEHRTKMSQRDRGKSTSQKFSSVAPIEFLFKEYKAKCWWFEIFVCFTRLMTTGGTVAFKEGSAIQVALGMLMAVLSIFTYGFYRPYINKEDNALAIFAQW